MKPKDQIKENKNILLRDYYERRACLTLIFVRQQTRESSGKQKKNTLKKKSYFIYLYL